MFDGHKPPDINWYYVPLEEGSPRDLSATNGNFNGAFVKDGWAVFGLGNQLVAVDVRTGESRVLVEEKGRVLRAFLAGPNAVVYEIIAGDTHLVKRVSLD